MQKIAQYLLVTFLVGAAPAVCEAAVRVSGYYRSNGTYVQPHYRSSPDGNPYNNWSTYPNINPYTGAIGTVRMPLGLSIPVEPIQEPNVFRERPILKDPNGTQSAQDRRSRPVASEKPEAQLPPGVVPLTERPDLASGTMCSVVRVVDGDTIVVKGKDGMGVKVRLIGVDTPETVHPSKPVERFGKEASAFTTSMLEGKQVLVVTDPQQGTTDVYGRTLAYVYRAPDSVFVNAEIVRQGYGHAYTKYPFRYMKQFVALEQMAREAGKGLWAPDATGQAGQNETPAVAQTPAPPDTQRIGDAP